MRLLLREGKLLLKEIFPMASIYSRILLSITEGKTTTVEIKILANGGGKIRKLT
jgi:hypothetical protein